jgi:uncharacterized protein YcbX
MNPSSNEIGSLVSLWRYPVKSMMMTMLAQGDLPRDTGILKTAAKHNQVNVGVYASVLTGGVIRRGDVVRIEGA